MKTAVMALLVVLVCVTLVFGDEVDDGLSMATAQIRTSARQMIESGIDKDESIRMTRLMLQNRFREGEVLRAHQIVMSAGKSGIPVGPVMDKAFEGMTKQVESRNVVRAMEVVQERYGIAQNYANRIIEEKTHRVQIQNAIAQSLTAGLRERDVKGLTEALQNRARAENMASGKTGPLAVETFTTARDMARLGVPPGAIVEVLSQAIQQRYSAMEMKTMNRSFANQSRSVAPNVLAERYTRGIRGGTNAERLSDYGTERGSISHGDSGYSGSGAGSGGGGGGGGGGGSGSGGR